jgi:hypothetical protein
MPRTAGPSVPAVKYPRHVLGNTGKHEKVKIKVAILQCAALQQHTGAHSYNELIPGFVPLDLVARAADSHFVLLLLHSFLSASKHTS